MPSPVRPAPHVLPSLALVVGGALWGLFWIPIREIGALGFEGAWPGFLVYLTCTVIFVPIVLVGKNLVRSPLKHLMLCGLFTGAAFTLYAVSVLLTDVVRVLLLFYLTPVWSTLLGAVFLGERITVHRMLALICGIVGLAVILGAGLQFPWPRNLGDWLALASGLSWTIGSMLLYRMPQTGVFEQMLAFVLGCVAVSMIFLVFGNASLSPPVVVPDFVPALIVVVLTALFVLPIMYLTLWPISILSPGRAGLLLMSEALVGIASAAWLAGEVFGLREILGAVLIVGASAIEIVGAGMGRSAAAGSVH